MKKSIVSSAAIVTLLIMGALFALPVVSQAQTVACPAGYTCTPITSVPNCPTGFVCTPITSPSPTVPAPTPTSCYIFSSNLGVGSRGVDVVALQTWLIDSGFNIPLISTGVAQKGYFGPSTAAALSAYQASVGLSQTGALNPQTRTQLNGSCFGTPPVITSQPSISYLQADAATQDNVLSTGNTRLFGQGFKPNSTVQIWIGNSVGGISVFGQVNADGSQVAFEAPSLPAGAYTLYVVTGVTLGTATTSGTVSSKTNTISVTVSGPSTIICPTSYTCTSAPGTPVNGNCPASFTCTITNSTMVPSITRISAPASLDSQIYAGSKFAIEGTNFVVPDSVYVGNESATVIQDGNWQTGGVLYAIAPSDLQSGPNYVYVKNINGTSNQLSVTVFGSSNTTAMESAAITSGGQTSSLTPTISGTASGVTQVGVVLSDSIVPNTGDKVYGSGLIPVVNGNWSVTVSPALVAGQYTVYVYNANNNQLTSGVLNVTSPTQTSQPSITSISPTGGYTGTAVRIYGSGFVSGDTIRISGPAFDQTVTPNSVSSSQIVFTMPTLIPGAYNQYNIQVDSGGVLSGFAAFSGLGSVNTASPLITSISPSSGTSGTVVTVYGSNFAPEDSILISGPAFSQIVSQGNSQSLSQLSFTVPTLISGGTHQYNVQVALNGVGVGNTAVFTGTGSAQPSLPDLVVTNITADQNYLYVTYQNNGGASQGSFVVNVSTPNGSFTTNPLYPYPVPAAGASVTTPGITLGLVGLAPGSTANVTATVDSQNQVAESNENNNTFTKSVTVPGSTTAPAPSISSISPTSATVGSTVSVTGSNFDSTSFISLNGTGFNTTNQSATLLSFTVPAISPGTYTVQVGEKVGSGPYPLSNSLNLTVVAQATTTAPSTPSSPCPLGQTLKVSGTTAKCVTASIQSSADLTASIWEAVSQYIYSH